MRRAPICNILSASSDYAIGVNYNALEQTVTEDDLNIKFCQEQEIVNFDFNFDESEFNGPFTIEVLYPTENITLRYHFRQGDIKIHFTEGKAILEGELWGVFGSPGNVIKYSICGMAK